MALRAAVLLVIGLLGCTNAGTPEADPSLTPPASHVPAVPSPTEEPASAATPPVVTAPAGILPPGSRATVTADELRIRESPGLTGTVIGTTRAGDVVLAGSFLPFHTNFDGIDWYAVFFADGYSDWPALPSTWDVGWVAAGIGAERYLELLPSRCPTGAPDLATLTSLTPWDRLACFGDRPLTIAGTWGCRGCGGTAIGNFEPRWLAYPIVGEWLRISWPDGAILELRVPPDSGIAVPEGGSIARVTGHFDDPAAATCVYDGAGLVRR